MDKSGGAEMDPPQYGKTAYKIFKTENRVFSAKQRRVGGAASLLFCPWPFGLFWQEHVSFFIAGRHIKKRAAKRQKKTPAAEAAGVRVLGSF